MQHVATKVFIYASITFGLLGMLFVLTLPGLHGQASELHVTITKLLMATVFVILPSFALSVAAKYLNGKL